MINCQNYFKNGLKTKQHSSLSSQVCDPYCQLSK